MRASREGHWICVKELLNKGAQVNIQNTVSAVEVLQWTYLL